MAASSDRRRRYERSLTDQICPLTPAKLALLQYIAEFRIASLPQLARLACPSEKSARRHCRALFDSGWISVVPVSRLALTSEADANDLSLLYGSAPNLYTITSAGLRILRRAGWDGEAEPAPKYGPRNSLFLGHELAIRDFRVWLEVTSRLYQSHRLERWADGSAAELKLEGSQGKVVRPDAWFAYQLGDRVLIGLLEADLGTERGTKRWTEKVTAYRALFASGQLPKITGYANARVIVTAPTPKRRDALCELVARQAGAGLASRFWFTVASELATCDITAPLWRSPGVAADRALVTGDLAVPRTADDTPP